MNIDIQNLSSSGLSRKEIEENFANDKRLSSILSIFDKINSFDGEMGNTLSKADIDAFLYYRQTAKDSFGVYEKINSLDNSHDGEVTDFEIKLYLEKSREFYGEDITVEDLKKFIEFSAKQGDKNYQEECKEIAKQTNLPYKLVYTRGPNHLDGIEKLIENNQTVYKITFDEDEYIVYDKDGNTLRTCYKSDEDTNLIEEYRNGECLESRYINTKTGEMIGYKDEYQYKYDQKSDISIRSSFDATTDELKIEEIRFKSSEIDSTAVSFKYDADMKLVGLEIKKENDTTQLHPEGYYGENGTLYITSFPEPKTEISEDVMNSIKQMLDGGARYGEDFELEIKDGQLKIKPKIKNATDSEMPEFKGAALERYKELVAQGIHQGEDFEVTYQEDGTFKFAFKNNQAREFNADYKSETYDKNGNLISSITIKNDEVIEEIFANGVKEVRKTSFDDKLVELILKNDFATTIELLGEQDVISGGFNFSNLVSKYKERTGHELVEDLSKSGLSDAQKLKCRIENETNENMLTVLNFDVTSSQVAHLLPKIKRTELGQSHFKEEINGNAFEVQIKGKDLVVSKNGGKAYKLDISKLPKNFVNNVFIKMNALNLYDMAINKVNLKVNDNLNNSKAIGENGEWSAHKGSLSTQNGTYDAKNNEIMLDPNATINSRMLNCLAHESGHMVDAVDDKENATKIIKENMKSELINFGADKPVTLQELLEKNGTSFPVSLTDEALNNVFNQEFQEFRKNPPEIDSHWQYALESIPEFFAESYALITTGHSRSEYILANYFPKSLERVSQIIERNRARDEAN